MVYDVTDPEAPRFVQCINNRDFEGDPKAGTARDLSPAILLFIPHSESPVAAPLLIAANAVSGTTTLFRVRALTK